MRIVVTGGAGFIGANLCRELLERGHDVAVLDNLSTGSRANLASLDVELVERDLNDSDAFDVFRGAAAVVHLAARNSVPRSLIDPLRTHEVNDVGTVHVLEALRRYDVPHVIVSSSSSVYGANSTLPTSEDCPLAPLSPYAASKAAMEGYVRAYSSCFGISALVFRFFNVFGPLQTADHDYAAVIPTFVAQALRDEPLPVYGDGTQSRDFTYVGSVTSLLVDAVERRVTADGPVNLAFGSRRSLLDVVRELEEILGRDVKCEFLEPRAGDVRHSQADTTKLKRLFPDAQPVPFADGLRQTVDWLRDVNAARASR